MVKQDAQFVNNHAQNSFRIFKQNVKNSRMVLNNKVNNPQETFTSRNAYQVPQYHLKEQQYKKVEEWQKQQDLLVKYSYQNNHFIPNYPSKIKADLSLRFQRHYAQNQQFDKVKDQNDSYQQTNEINQTTNNNTELAEQIIQKTIIKKVEIQKKSNLKRAKNQTTEKKTVKIKDNKKSISESPENQPKLINKPPLPKIQNDKLSEQQTSLQQQPGMETVDSFLRNAK
ncbi:unnamed protein product (macronuclear) [Paramecium tetraurelia]|uniref:Uncharacterized protein n=1 Tax=Paramecium tetraurelia TaxID=5888 RepID=A0EEM7_PARTE|nr:uncharacterized protein GSPATT00026090001 [Paramecium tetraurelia]CAK93768.1 unnamed protein product [Paramecium tetraurelia]|eukprot:XP_001461141.1 hypothetical protein (macronuclear) [Paramecium tetraurelia strain d4-2]